MKEPVRVHLSRRKINDLLGTELSREEMLSYLAKVELAYDEKTNEIVAPTFRADIFRTADICGGSGTFLRIRQYSYHTS